MPNITSSAAWKNLEAHYTKVADLQMRDLFAQDPQRFAKFHEYLDRLVDPSAINRWPVPALERTAPGLIAGYLMGAAAGVLEHFRPTLRKRQL